VSPFVSFVGAGPGEAELVTLKAVRRLREAAVIVHDRLIPRELLDHARDDAEVIDAGKAPGRHGLAQPEINWLLVDRARRRGRVVRLKGGDPGVFARLAEEIQAVRSAGINVEIVPGVSAAMAAAARAGISLTERASASTVVFATGSDHHGALPALDWEMLARTEGTLVFYMAVGALEAITSTLTALGRDAREPALLVERCGFVDEQMVAGRLGDIAGRAHAAGVQAPALLLVGPTVAAASAPLAVTRMTTVVASV
jgi:uroporphyrin-III C-methyltransferase / precorrin-2 dehydrogenase / sirohydrochlorin ferrochelatase